MTNRIRTVTLLGASLLAAPAILAGGRAASSAENRLEREVRHELVTLPFYSVFDYFTFRVDGGAVTLMGSVTQPTLKSAAENVVKGIEGVTRVVNQIEVLPLSPNDDRLRRNLYAAIYGNSVLDTLALRAVPPIHIIVKNGHVTLEGVVANQMQKTVAATQANSVAGVFSVTNSLRVEDAP
jgi:hyperosmotically inducible periplasmic protein